MYYWRIGTFRIVWCLWHSLFAIMHHLTFHEHEKCWWNCHRSDTCSWQCTRTMQWLRYGASSRSLSLRSLSLKSPSRNKTCLGRTLRWSNIVSQALRNQHYSLGPIRIEKLTFVASSQIYFMWEITSTIYSSLGKILILIYLMMQLFITLHLT